MVIGLIVCVQKPAMPQGDHPILQQVYNARGLALPQISYSSTVLGLPCQWPVGIGNTAAMEKFVFRTLLGFAEVHFSCRGLLCTHQYEMRTFSWVCNFHYRNN